MALTILVDMDGVCANLNKALCEIIANDYGVYQDPKNIVNYDLAKAFPELKPCKIYNYFRKDWFWRALEPIADSVEYVTKMHEDGHTIRFVTSCPGGHEGKINWLEKHFKHIRDDFTPWYHIIFTPHKSLVKGDFLIDDLPKNILAFNEANNWHGDTPPGVLYQQPYNLDYEGLRVLHMGQFYDIVNAVDEHKKERSKKWC